MTAPAKKRAGRALGVGALLMAMSASASAGNLLKVFEAALASDPEFLAIGAERRAAQEVRPQALAALRPSTRLSFDRMWHERQRVADFRSDRLILNVEQPLYRRDRRIGVAQTESRISRADALYAAARQDLIIRVAERYFRVLEAEDEIGFAKASLEAFELQLTQSRLRFEAGLIAFTDVEEAKAGFDFSRAQLIAAKNALDIAREALRETTGAYQEQLVPLGEMQLVMPTPADIDRWTETALERNLRLQARRHDAEIARQEIERIQADHLPAVDAIGSFSLNNSSSGPFRQTKSADIGLRLSLSLYSGGSVVSRTRESRHRYQQALDLLERERRRTQRETRDAYLGVDSGISRVHALEQAVRSNETAAKAIKAGFQVGTRTSVDVLDAQRELFRVRRDLSAARYDYILDILRLKRAAGVLSEHDLQLVSAWLG